MGDFIYTDRLRNIHRRNMLIALYEKPTHYSELLELTGLKPGSIYHHLKILDELVEKQAQGIYRITELGIRIIEQEKIVDKILLKPKKVIEVTRKNSEFIDQIWLGNLNKILIIFILLVTLLLGTQGIALAGSAIYVIGSWNVLIFDISVFFLGWAVLLFIEYITPQKIYNQIWFSLSIRLLSMLPGTIVGLTLYLLYSIGIVPNNMIYPILFAITTLAGLLVAGIGEHFLRVREFKFAMRIAILPISIDLLFGIVILLTTIS